MISWTLRAYYPGYGNEGDLLVIEEKYTPGWIEWLFGAKGRITTRDFVGKNHGWVERINSYSYPVTNEYDADELYWLWQQAKQGKL